jgi:predicted lactoylglutathione lyase
MNKIYLNLPVSDLKRSIEFYTAVGFSELPQFKDEHSTGLRLGDITLMILENKRFLDFTTKRLVDAHTEVQAIFSFSVETREEVDKITEKALAMGADEPSPKEDYPFMYGRSFSDPDGHMWGPFFYDENIANSQQ